VQFRVISKEIKDIKFFYLFSSVLKKKIAALHFMEMRQNHTFERG